MTLTGTAGQSAVLGVSTKMDRSVYRPMPIRPWLIAQFHNTVILRWYSETYKLQTMTVASDDNEDDCCSRYVAVFTRHRLLCHHPLGRITRLACLSVCLSRLGL